MDARSLDLLGFPAVRERLAGETAFAGGRQLAERLAPSPDVDEVERRQAETAEGCLLLELGAPSLAGAHDVREPVAHAARGGTLSPPALRAVADTAACAVAVRGTLEERREAAPLLAGRAAAVERELATLASELARVVDESGVDVLDRASPRLRSLRRELAATRLRAVERMQALARSDELRPHLQEGFVTERAGRPVLAVRTEARTAVPGIVHDGSGSGRTLFVEPFAVVELNNRQRELEAEERDEVERILAAASALVASLADALCAAVDALAAIDLALASAALSRRWGGVPVTRGGRVELEQARHPLLDPDQVVPLDLALGELRVVVISGPNTGGKTVALKTLGLLAACHQAGLRLPARNARLPVFDRVLADIGDEQSIEASLSTFSGHLRRLVGVLGEAGPRSLVLLDEIAAGTDPVEGSALGKAVLERLAGQARLTLATTHSAELEEWASEAAECENAAMGFDPESLRPTYELALGRPGLSHALAIAERLGLDEDVVTAARAHVAPERRRVAALLAAAEQAERAARLDREAARAALQQADAHAHAARRREQELAAALAEVAAGAAAERAAARRRAEDELRAADAELAQLRAEIRDARRAERERAAAPAAAATELERERDRRLGAASERRRRTAGELLAAAERPLRSPVPLALGDPVVAPALGVRGTLAALDGEDAEVHAGGLRVRVPLAALSPDPRGGPVARGERDVVVRAAASADVPDQIDVRGERADEARELVRAFVDAAHMAGREQATVVHGRGTGAVRRAVRAELDRHPLVARWESRSADGATEVRLA